MITSILDFISEGFETFRPLYKGCLDLEVVRVEMAGPFPVLQGVGYVIPVGHGRLSRIKVQRVNLSGYKPLEWESHGSRVHGWPVGLLSAGEG